MEERSNLETSRYAPRKRRRGCIGCAVLIGLVVVVLVAVSNLSFLAPAGLPVPGGAVGVVRIEGPIYESRHFTKLIRVLRKSPWIKSIVLRLDTPGGAVGASEEIYREALRARREDKKHVVASMGNAAASGGYYIAAAAEEIFANAGTMTGSIGVIAMDMNVEETLRKLGVRSEVVKSGEHKDTGSPFREWTPEDRYLMQNVIFDVYRQFFRVVLESRHRRIDRVLEESPGVVEDVLETSRTKSGVNAIETRAFTTGTIASEVGASVAAETALRAMADGRVITGEQAKKLGLVDHLGSLEDAVARAGDLAGIGRNPVVIERSPETGIPALLGASARTIWSEIRREDTRLEYRSPVE